MQTCRFFLELQVPLYHSVHVDPKEEKTLAVSSVACKEPGNICKSYSY